MCNLYKHDTTLVQLAKDFKEILNLELDLDACNRLDNQRPKPDVYPRYQGIFAKPIDPAAPEAGLEPMIGRWGLVPFFHKGPASEFKFATNNARSEDMHVKPTFRDALKRRRCIIPATSFVEWTGPKGSKTKHTITRADGAPLFFAGLWADHSHGDETTVSYTMVMQAAEGDHDMAPFHNRQPVVLGRESARTWLDLSADWRAVIAAPPVGTLMFDPPDPALNQQVT